MMSDRHMVNEGYQCLHTYIISYILCQSWNVNLSPTLSLFFETQALFFRPTYVTMMHSFRRKFTLSSRAFVNTMTKKIFIITKSYNVKCKPQKSFVLMWATYTFLRSLENESFVTTFNYVNVSIPKKIILSWCIVIIDID